MQQCQMKAMVTWKDIAIYIHKRNNVTTALQQAAQSGIEPDTSELLYKDVYF